MWKQNVATGQNITVNGFKIACTNCGYVHGFKSANEFVDFYENRHRIRKKSVYHRKYHILNAMNDRCVRGRGGGMVEGFEQLKPQPVNFQLLANSGGMENKLRVLAQFKLPCKKTLAVSGQSYWHK